MFTTFNKAIVAFLASIASLFALFHINVPFLSDPSVQAVIASVIVGAVTYLVPNKVTPDQVNTPTGG